MDSKIKQLDEAADQSRVSTRRSTLNSVLIVFACTLAAMLIAANNMSTTISLSAIKRELNMQDSELKWLVSGYSLSSGCLLLVFGRLADLYGRKKIFSWGLLYFAAFTIGCGFAQDKVTLEVLRGFQGVGGAAIIPASLGILAQSFPPSKARVVAFSTFSAGSPVGTALGQFVGGIMTDTTKTTWRSAFYMNCGLTTLSLIIGLISIDADVPSSETDRRVDFLGAFLITTGLVLFLFVLGQGEAAPQQWRTPYIIALLIVSVVLIAAFVAWQHYLEKKQADPYAPHSALTPPPLMKLSIWTRARGRFAAMMCIAVFTWCAFISWTFWAPLYYENYKGYSALKTVIRLMPMFVTGVLCNVFITFVIDYWPIIYIMVLGTLGTTTACLLFAIIIPSASYWAFGFPAAVLCVFGADLVFATGILFVAKVSRLHEQSLAGAIFQTITQLGYALGVTVTTVVFNRVAERTSNPGQQNPSLKSYQSAQWTAFVFGTLAIILSVVSFTGVGIVGNQGQDEQNQTLTEEMGTLP